MGYAVAALFCVGFLWACVWAGSVLSVVSVCVYTYLDRAFAGKLRDQCARAFDSGHRKGVEDGKRISAYDHSELPKTAGEAFETKSWAESLAPLYPNDPEFKKAADSLRKEKDMLDKADESA